MKLRQNHMRTFNDELLKLRDEIDSLLHDSREWVKDMEYRETYGTPRTSASHTAYTRDKLEAKLTEFRLHMGSIYDFMSDKGLRNMDKVV